MARQVLEDRQDAAGKQALGHGAGNGRNLARFRAIGAVADDRIVAVDRHVGNRQAVDVNADGPEIGGDQMTGQPRRRQAGGRIAVINRAVAGAGRIDRPMRRPKPRHPAAFLIDQNGRFPADNVAEIPYQRS